MIKIIVISILFISGCDQNKSSGKVRHALFVECMELSAKITRQSDDDVSNIVNECDSVAVYTSNHLAREKN